MFSLARHRRRADFESESAFSGDKSAEVVADAGGGKSRVPRGRIQEEKKDFFGAV